MLHCQNLPQNTGHQFLTIYAAEKIKPEYFGVGGDKGNIPLEQSPPPHHPIKSRLMAGT